MKMTLSLARITLGTLFLATPFSSSANELAPTSDALISIQGDVGWNMGLQLQNGRREWVDGAQTLSADTRKLGVRGGVRLAKIMHIWGEVGVMEAEFTEEKGDGGLAWGVGGGLSIIEYVIRQSPVLGKQEVIALEVEASYRRSESGFDKQDLKWNDTRIAPLFVYRVDQRSAVLWRPYQPTGYVWRMGPLYNRTDGSFGEMDLEEKNEFGALVGVDVRFHSGWMARLEMQWLDSSDREWTLGVHRYF